MKQRLGYYIAFSHGAAGLRFNAWMTLWVDAELDHFQAIKWLHEKLEQDNFILPVVLTMIRMPKEDRWEE